MFAAIYFGQVVFAGLPYVTIVPPPPPPPPTYDYCHKYAVGMCIGTSEASASIKPVGTSGRRRGLPLSVGVANRRARVGTPVGLPGGPRPGEDCCP